MIRERKSWSNIYSDSVHQSLGNDNQEYKKDSFYLD